MTSYVSIFGANSISPALAAYNDLLLTGDITLVWPLETAPNSNLACPIMDINPGSTGAYNITLPAASQVGTGTYVLVNNRSAFSQNVLNAGGDTLAGQAPGSIYFYYVQDNDTVAGAWGAFQYGAQISAPSAAALAGPGIRAVGAALGQDIDVLTFNTSQVLDTTAQTALYNWNGGTGSFTLPLAAAAGKSWYIQVRNSGTGILSVLNTGSDTINGAANLLMNPGDSCILVTDGVTWVTIGLGPSLSTLNLNPATINLGGLSGNVVLAGAQLNRIIYTLTGAPSGNITIVVPNTAQEYWIRNATTGPFAVAISTSGQSLPPGISSGSAAIFYCDGANVYLATPSGVITSIPVVITQGGTGATSAAQALVNLGGGTTGINIFQSVTASAAAAAIGATTFADAYLMGTVL